MEKIRKQLLLFLALFVGLQSYAQTGYDPATYPYYDKVPTYNTETGENEYEEGSQDAWITTIDNNEWTVDSHDGDDSFYVNYDPDTNTTQFGKQAAGWHGSMTSPDFDTDSPLTLEITMNQLQHGSKKNHVTITFELTYKNTAEVEAQRTAEVRFDFAGDPEVLGYENLTLEHLGTQHYKMTVDLPNDFLSNGHTQIHFYAEGGLQMAASSNGHNTIEVTGENLVLREDRDNSERLRRNAGKKMKKVTIVRPYTQGWYTLSLPFDLTMKQFQRRFMAGFDKSNADNYTWKENTSAEIWEYSSFVDDCKTMQFTKNYSYGPGTDDEVLKAAVPYLIYIPETIENTLFDFTKNESTPIDEEIPGDIQEGDKVMVFTNITLASEETLFGTDNTVEKATGYKFVSNLSKTDLSSVMASNQIYYLGLNGSDPVLKKPSATSSTNIKGFRAYFVSPKETGEAKPALLSFSEPASEPTSIGSVETQFTTAERVYNMQGQYVGKSLKDLPRGIYVVNHKKYVIK